MAGPLIGVVMGSQSDWETMRAAAEVLDELGVPHEVRIVSAHRTPDRLFAYAEAAAGRGLRVIIAGAGGAAHLPGMLAAKTRLPVLGVPVQSKALGGLDSLLSIVQMPKGVPVGTLAIGPAGAANAGLLAAAMLATTDDGAGRAARRLARGADRRRWRRRPMAPEPLPPGSRIGILGGGQLGRMLAMAAARLGHAHPRLRAGGGRPGGAGGERADRARAYDDAAALARLRRRGRRRHLRVRERARSAPSTRIAARVPVRPGRRALEVAQDRLAEKAFLNGIGLATAPWAAVDGPDGAGRGARRGSARRRS